VPASIWWSRCDPVREGYCNSTGQLQRGRRGQGGKSARNGAGLCAEFHASGSTHSRHKWPRCVDYRPDRIWQDINIPPSDPSPTTGATNNIIVLVKHHHSISFVARLLKFLPRNFNVSDEEHGALANAMLAPVGSAQSQHWSSHPQASWCRSIRQLQKGSRLATKYSFLRPARYVCGTSCRLKHQAFSLVRLTGSRLSMGVFAQQQKYTMYLVDAIQCDRQLCWHSNVSC